MTIVPYDEQYYSGLLDFSRRTWPHKPAEYLEYRLRQLPAQASDTQANLLVLDDDGKIVGCNLFFPTRAMIDGVETNIVWSHDTFVEEAHRADAGLELILRVNATQNMFGKGLSEINRKIQQKLKTNFITIANTYWIFNFWAFKLPLYKFGMLEPRDAGTPDFPKYVRVGSDCFERIDDPGELNIPNSGYWNASAERVDLIRDRHFLQKRFFDNFNTYTLYRRRPAKPGATDDCYFVVRKVRVRNFPILSLVDFRFDAEFPGQYRRIIRAASKIARRNALPATLLESTIPLKSHGFYPLILRAGGAIDIITNLKKLHKPIITTAADSDSDFLRFD